MFSGFMSSLPSVRLSVRPSINKYFTWRDFSSFTGGISVKLGTNTCTDMWVGIAERNFKFMGQRSSDDYELDRSWPLMGLIQNLHKYLLQLGDDLIRFLRSRGQRSRLCSDARRNLVKSTACEPQKGFEPKLKQILTVVVRHTSVKVIMWMI